MTWSRQPVAAALTEILAEAAPTVSCFDQAPETANAPALVCSEPTRVAKRTAGMGVDETEFVVIALAAMDQSDALGDLADIVDKAVMANSTLGGIAMAAMVTEYRNWRQLNIAGANYRAVDIAIRIDM